VIDLAGGFAEAADLCERSAFVVRVVAEELFTNLLRHDRGGSGDIEVVLASLDGSLVLRLRDFGVEEPDMRAIELRRSEVATRSVPEHPAGSPAEPREPGGLGVRIVDTLTDRLEYDYSDRTLTVTATIHTEKRDVRPDS
jgi:anti-sigma regulatory factor (Ser/Thr protein kinase)